MAREVLQPPDQEQTYGAVTDVVLRSRVGTDVADRFVLRADGTRLYGGGALAPGAAEDAPYTTQTAISNTYGFYTYSPTGPVSSAGLTTQRLFLGYFRAPLTISCATMKAATSAYSATGHTYSGIGVYSENSDGSLTLEASVTETGAPPVFLGSSNLFTSGVASTPALSATVNFVAGKIYAVGLVAVFTGGAINFASGLLFSDTGNWRTDFNLGVGVRRGLYIAGQTTIPASITNAAIAAGTSNTVVPICRFYP